MRINIESRDGIEARAKEAFPARTALISVTDTDADFAVLENAPDYLLQMKFDDINFDDINDGISREEEALDSAEKYHMFTNEQAKEIAAFFESILGEAELLICQCEYGQSRSAGIAAAIVQHLYGRGIEIFIDERYCPSKLVCKKVLYALGGSRRFPDGIFIDEGS